MHEEMPFPLMSTNCRKRSTSFPVLLIHHQILERPAELKGDAHEEPGNARLEW
jgi:hypothetical protein